MQDLSDPTIVEEACTRGLRWGMDHAWPDVEVDHDGNVVPMEYNFPRYMRGAWGTGELGEWKYHDPDLDFEEYMRSVRSSLALTLNCFGPLMRPGSASASGATVTFMWTAWSPAHGTGKRMPTSRIWTWLPSGRVVIVPTCIDYLAPKRPRITEHSETFTEEGVTDAWAAELRRIHKGERTFYWEPMDEGLSQLFREHRQEIAEFAKRVAGGSLHFEALSWLDLWNDWAETGDPLLQRQVAELGARYEVPAWAWEGVSWIDGRLTNFGLEDW